MQPNNFLNKLIDTLKKAGIDDKKFFQNIKALKELSSCINKETIDVISSIIGKMTHDNPEFAKAIIYAAVFSMIDNEKETMETNFTIANIAMSKIFELAEKKPGNVGININKIPDKDSTISLCSDDEEVLTDCLISESEENENFMFALLNAATIIVAMGKPDLMETFEKCVNDNKKIISEQSIEFKHKKYKA